MLGVSCLVKNTKLHQDIKDLIEYTAYSRVSKGKDASIASIYNDIRKAGVEIDLQTVGHLYNEALPKSYRQFTSDVQVNDFVLRDYNESIRRAALLEPTKTEKQIGRDKPDLAVVNGMLNMFYNANVENESLTSDMRTMQEALWKAAKKKLNLPESQQPKDKDQWRDILNRSLGYEKLGITDVAGKLNGIADLYNSMRDQLRDATGKLMEQGDFYTAEKWEEMIDKLEASTYSLIFSQKEAKDFITGVLKEGGFGKTLKNGDTIIDWNKISDGINSVQDIRSNVEKVLADNGFNQDVIEGVKDSMEEDFNDLMGRVYQYRAKTLQSKEDAIGKSVNSKSDLKRLAELNNLGIFESQHDKLLNNLIGLSDIEMQDLEDLQQLAGAASELYRKIDKGYGSDVFAASAFQSIQRSIDSIISRNINNKSRLNRIISAIKNFFDVYMTGLLMSPLTITENFISGVKEIASPLFLGKASISKEDLALYGAMIKDVTARGQAYGEEVGSFAPRELYSNTLKMKWSGASVKEKFESVLAAVMIPARIGLLGFDSANKAVITNKVFYNTAYKALLQNGKTSDEAKYILNDALHGKSFEDAKKDAKDILVSLNNDLPATAQIPVNNATVIRLANDLVKSNLNMDGTLTNEMIESMIKSSYHVAGYGLGHEPNNILSRGVKGVRDASAKKETQLIKEKKWDELAWQRLKSTFVNSMILRFTGGATNWIILRLQSGLGLGLATGFMGKWNSDIDFKDKDTIMNTVKEMQNSRNQIGRALTGISFTMFGYMMQYILTSGGDDERRKNAKRLSELREIKRPSEEEKAEIKKLDVGSNLYKQIKSNYQGNRLFKKLAPDAMLLNYYMDTSDNAFLGALNYVQATGGLNSPFSSSSKIMNAGKYAKGGDYDAARGELAGIAGGSLGVPAWRAYKEWGKMAKWIGGGEVASDYKKPTTLSEGLWGGGALEDLGFYSRNSGLTAIPGVGPKSYELFKSKGMKNMSDIKNKPDWYETTYVDDNGNEHYILDSGGRKKAKEGSEKWFKEND